MIKCVVEGLFVGFTDLPNRNGNLTSRCYDIYDLKMKTTFQVFRCDKEFQEGAMVSLPCELRLRQNGSPYFVYSDAQQNEDKSTVKEK